MPNRLINETSPYLLQHAHNPVDWYAWGDEAFAKAKAEDKPVLVSIGYAACHWCHVMEHESFEDPDIAAKMNERFISIKVDREEHPDVDSIYMEALQRLHGHGGWPLNVFVMPDGRPFYGGTYFPNTPRVGMPSWPDVLDAVADAYHNRRESVLQNAEALTSAILASTQTVASDEPLRAGIAAEAFAGIASAFDEQHGGFGGAPKFPQPMVLGFLLRHHARTGEPRARHLIEHTLRSM
ncbi:MAG: thioredoxin domain-containing protein, partial [Chloroflexi bacterium]|nr:thioredoxin domain-containing protein [Chloroflexota bacterium]